MTIKLKRLERRIQEIQEFVNPRIERDQIFTAVSQELTKIADVLKQGKLTVQIVSHTPVSGQKIQNFLKNYNFLKEEYRFYPILQFCDFNSISDTYVNGQQLQKNQILQSGRATLEYEKYRLTGCNILCLVIPPDQIQKIEQLQLIQQLSKTQISTLVVVVEVSEVAGEFVLLNAIKDEIKTWIKRHTNCVEIEIYSLCESDLEIFFHSLKALTKHSEDILIKNFTASLLTQLTLIEDFLTQQLKGLEVEQQQANLQSVGGEPRRQFDETIKLINNDKTSVIKEIKSKLNQSVIDLLDKFYRDSIICQIRKAVNELEPKIIKREGSYVYIHLVKTIKKANKYSLETQKICNSYTELQNTFFQKTYKQPNLITYAFLNISYFLQSLMNKIIDLNYTNPNKKNNLKYKYKIQLIQEDSVDANTVLTEYYRYTLSKWAAQEWENVCSRYAEGGLRKFFQTTYERFNLSCLHTVCFCQPSQSIDILPIFARSVDQPSCETSYVKVSLLSFIFSRIRNHLMPFLTISFALSILGIANRRQIARWTVQPVLSAFEYAPLLTTLIIIFVIYCLIKALLQTYHKHNVAEMKKAEDKLKEEMYRFYSELVKHLTEKIRQKILLTIETEEQRLDENIQVYRQLIEQTNEAVESNQPLLKKQIQQRKESLKYLNQELSELQKLKRRN